MNQTNGLFKRQLTSTLVLVAISAATVACGDDTGSGGQGGGGTSAAETSASGSTKSGSSATQTSASTTTTVTSTSESSASTGMPQKPADCVDLMVGVALVNPHQASFDTSDATPIVRTPLGTNLSGAVDLVDRLKIVLTPETSLGINTITDDATGTIADFTNDFVATVTAGVSYEEDAGMDGYMTTFVAKGGEVEIAERITGNQTQGTLRYAELREVAIDDTTGAYTFVTGGACYWIQELAYDTRLAKGCVPYTDSCGAGEFCMPLNAIGTDGECATTGTKQLGETCTRANATSWDSDCAAGMRCLHPQGDPDATCFQVCDVLSNAPGCPAGTHCGGGYNLCLDESVLQNSGIDPAAVGEACEDDPLALYCGGSGRPGNCYDDDGDGPLPSMCNAFHGSPADCTAPQIPSFIGYKNGIDRSTLWCLTWPTPP